MKSIKCGLCTPNVDNVTLSLSNKEMINNIRFKGYAMHLNCVQCLNNPLCKSTLLIEFIFFLFTLILAGQSWSNTDTTREIRAARRFPLLPARSDRSRRCPLLHVHCLLPLCSSPPAQQIFNTGW